MRRFLLQDCLYGARQMDNVFGHRQNPRHILGQVQTSRPWDETVAEVAFACITLHVVLAMPVPFHACAEALKAVVVAVVAMGQDIMNPT